MALVALGRMSVLAAEPSSGVERRATIEGGRRVGNYEIGKKFSQYEKVLGEPTRVQQSENADDARMVYYKRYGIFFFIKKDRINGIAVVSPLFATLEGVHLGTSRDEVERIYGQPQALRDEDVVYPQRGLAFTFADGRVAKIFVQDAEAPDLASGDLRIVPGVRVGGLQLGQSVQFVLNQWKNPDQRSAAYAGTEMWSYKNKGVIVLASQGRIGEIWIYSPAFRTARDIHVGSRRDDVVRAYGRPQGREENVEAYPQNGLKFAYENGQVKTIFVLENKGGK
jgi:hypothetical protein